MPTTSYGASSARRTGVGEKASSMVRSCSAWTCFHASKNGASTWSGRIRFAITASQWYPNSAR